MKKSTGCSMETVQALFAVLGYDRPEIAYNGILVHMLTGCFYEYLPFACKRQINYQQLMYGALFHDIGKIHVPGEILNKPGKLTPEETAIVRGHARNGALILEKIPGMEGVSRWIGFHHERVDGKGYVGLKGEEIPVEARIVAITDTYASILVPSAFKPARTHEDAIAVLRMEEGIQFDAGLAEIFCQIPASVIAERIEQAGQVAKIPEL